MKIQLDGTITRSPTLKMPRESSMTARRGLSTWHVVCRVVDIFLALAKLQ